MLVDLAGNPMLYQFMMVNMFGHDPNHDYKDFIERWEAVLGNIKSVLSALNPYLISGGKTHTKNKQKTKKKGGTTRPSRQLGNRAVTVFLRMVDNKSGKINNKNNKNVTQKIGQKIRKKTATLFNPSIFSPNNNKITKITKITKNSPQQIQEAIRIAQEQQDINNLNIVEDLNYKLVELIKQDYKMQKFSLFLYFKILDEKSLNFQDALYYYFGRLFSGYEPGIDIRIQLIQTFTQKMLVLHPEINDETTISLQEFITYADDFIDNTTSIQEIVNKIIFESGGFQGGASRTTHKQKGGVNAALNIEEAQPLIVELDKFYKKWSTMTIESADSAYLENNPGYENFFTNVVKKINMDAGERMAKYQTLFPTITNTKSNTYETTYILLKRATNDVAQIELVVEQPLLLNLMFEIYRKASQNDFNITDKSNQLCALYNLVRKQMMDDLKLILTTAGQATSAGEVDSTSGSCSLKGETGYTFIPPLGKGTRVLLDTETYIDKAFTKFMGILITRYQTIITDFENLKAFLEAKQASEAAKIAEGGLNDLEKNAKKTILKWVTMISLSMVNAGSINVDGEFVSNDFEPEPSTPLHLQYMYGKQVNSMLRLIGNDGITIADAGDITVTNSDIDTTLFDAIKTVVDDGYSEKIIKNPGLALRRTGGIFRNAVNNAAMVYPADAVEVCPYSSMGDGQPNCTVKTSMSRKIYGNADVIIGVSDEDKVKFTCSNKGTKDEPVLTYTLEIITPVFEGITIITPDQTPAYSNIPPRFTPLVASITLGKTLDSLQALIDEIQPGIIKPEKDLVNSIFTFLFNHSKESRQDFLNSISNIWFKLMGDLMQEFNVVLKNGGMTDLEYDPNVEQWNNGAAVYGFFANDRPSAVRCIMWLLFGDDNDINLGAYGGYSPADTSNTLIVGRNYDNRDKRSHIEQLKAFAP